MSRELAWLQGENPYGGVGDILLLSCKDTLTAVKENQQREIQPFWKDNFKISYLKAWIKTYSCETNNFQHLLFLQELFWAFNAHFVV